MLENPGWFVIVIEVALLTLGISGIGVALGYQIGKQTASSGVAPIERPTSVGRTNRLPESIALNAAVAEKARVLSQLAFANRKSISPALAVAIEELIDAARELRRRTDFVLQVESMPASTPCIATIEVRDEPLSAMSGDGPSQLAKQKGLSGDELTSLTTIAGEAAANPPDLAKGRYKYECEQTIYRCYGEDATSWSCAGVQVQCHDLGTGGLSFFSTECPDYERIVVALGGPAGKIFMAADVTYSKVVCMHSQVGYLVGCRFTERLADFSEKSPLHLNRRSAPPSAAESVSARRKTEPPIAQPPQPLLA